MTAQLSPKGGATAQMFYGGKDGRPMSSLLDLTDRGSFASLMHNVDLQSGLSWWKARLADAAILGPAYSVRVAANKLADEGAGVTAAKTIDPEQSLRHWQTLLGERIGPALREGAPGAAKARGAASRPETADVAR